MKAIEYPEEARRKVLTGRPGFTPEWDMKVVLWLAAQTRGTIVEIGCNEGWMTRELALEHPDRFVVGVDFVTPTRAGTMCQGQAHEMPADLGRAARELKNVVLLNQNSRLLDYAAIEGAHGPVGFVFIDGDHSEEGVHADTEKALELVYNRLPEFNAAGGQKEAGLIVAWHDAYPDAPEWCGVWRYLESLPDYLEVTRVLDSWVAFARF